MIKIKLDILIGMLCFLLTSCFIDNDSEHGGSTYGQVDVTFSMTLPQPESVETHTRIGSSDTDIRNVDILIFDENGRFMNRVMVDELDLVQTGSGVNFSIRLDATPNRRTFHLIANGRTEIGIDRVNYADVAVGMLESTAIPLLHTVEPYNNGSLLLDIAPLVMWGRTELNGVSVVSKAEGVKLLRTVASIQVKTANAIPANGLGDFELREFYLVGAPKQGYLAPNDYQTGAYTPSSTRPFPARVYPTEFAVADAGSPIFMYESDFSVSNYQGVIISAMYKGQPYFYKVALVDGQVPLDIIRNHRYTLTVTKVSGSGYADIDTAVASAPSNAIKVSLTDDDEDFPCIVADGQYLMGLSNNSFVMYGYNTNRVELGTVYSSRGVQPVLSVPNGVDWLENLYAAPLGNNAYRITGNFEGATGQSRSTTLTLTCDNLSQTMRVDWNPAVSDSKDADSYVIALLGASDKNWTARVTSDATGKGLFLHPTASSPGYFTPSVGIGEGMVTELNSIYASRAYLHVGVGAQGELKVSTSVNGEAIARRIAIWGQSGN
ncbi:FimB/Mfa2 family fimbrial subunit [Bacteroides sp.]